MFFEIIIFIASIFIFSFLGSHLIKTLTNIAKFLKVREFVLAFFLMAFATSLTNLFVDVGAALAGLPQLAFGDIMGGNLVDLTLVMALAVFFGKKSLPAESEMVQNSAIFTGAAALLPLLLILDGNLSRIDGIILYLAFAVYTWWLFSKDERFKKIYSEKKEEKTSSSLNRLIKDIFKIIILLLLLVAASQAIIYSAQTFAKGLNVSLGLVGLLIVGLGNCFPEAYVSIVSSRKGQNWLILGEMMGSVIVCATLVLGTVVIISPFRIDDFSPYLIARLFMILDVLFFIVVIRTDQKIEKKEAFLLLMVYITFLLTEIFIRH